MFCESEPTTIRSMMEILQEHGELVVCCGSPLNMHNMPVFEAADMAGKMRVFACVFSLCCGSPLNMHNMLVFEAADMAGKVRV